MTLDRHMEWASRLKPGDKVDLDFGEYGTLQHIAESIVPLEDDDTSHIYDYTIMVAGGIPVSAKYNCISPEELEEMRTKHNETKKIQI